MSDARFRRSAGGVTSLGLHIVWCPKYRRRVLGGRVVFRLNELLDELNELLDEIAAENGWQIVAREVMPDHVHIFVSVRPTDSPADLARRFEGRTSRVLRAVRGHEKVLACGHLEVPAYGQGEVLAGGQVEVLTPR